MPTLALAVVAVAPLAMLLKVTVTLTTEPTGALAGSAIDAALFATSNPLSKGAILADEVGLGKTIEAGLLIAQKWAERKRRILVITPANLRKQWPQELADKFGIAAGLLEAKSYRQAIKDGATNPFDVTGNGATVLICSYQFAAGKAKDVQSVPWDLVVIDEAHRLRMRRSRFFGQSDKLMPTEPRRHETWA